ncbi:hypothetical protein IKP94_05025 [Candidatus Saccharibacteria bacterium]|nr:hypothetical protein [Candidatus Saccharibacteria bacterium]
MIKIFYGNEGAQAQAAIDRLLGDEYEVIEVDNLTSSDMPSVFMGTTLFGDERKILLKGLDENKECWAEITKYLDSPHKIVIWNEKAPDKRGDPGKSLAADKRVEIKGFERVVSKEETFAAFNMYDDAVRGNLKKALATCKTLEADKNKDPYSTLGAFTSKAFTALEKRDRKAPAILKILAEVDTEMKSTGIDGWTLVKKALLQISTIK